MKVAILADFPLHFIPELGEPFRPSGHYATWLPQLVEAFKRSEGFEIHWIVVSSKVLHQMEISWESQFFHVIPTESKNRASTFFAKDRRSIQKVLNQIQPAIVHAWGTEDVYALAAVLSGYPNIVSMQGILSHFVLKCKAHPRVYFQALIELFVLWRADLITTESTWGAMRIRHRNPFARIKLVEYGVQPHFFNVPWTPQPEKPVAIFIGRIDPGKGIQDLVLAFRDPSLANAELWVIGGDAGEWGETLRSSSPKNVCWLGRKSPSETADLLSQAWCLVLPTRADSSPNVVKEARVIGLPVVTSPCGGQISYITNGQNGFLVNPGNIGELTEKLQLLLTNLKFCQSLGAWNHEEQRIFFNPEQTARKFQKIYESFAPARGVH